MYVVAFISRFDPPLPGADHPIVFLDDVTRQFPTYEEAQRAIDSGDTQTTNPTGFNNLFVLSAEEADLIEAYE